MDPQKPASAPGERAARVQPVPPRLSVGEPLGMPLQHQMETSLGADFSHVRVHRASPEARFLGVESFSHGNDVHFLGRPTLQTIAHELAHVVQQRSGRAELAKGLIQT
jgi:hypothetical protein